MKKSILFTALVSLLFASCSTNDEMSSKAPLSSQADKTAVIKKFEQINASINQQSPSRSASGELVFNYDEQEFNKVGEMFTRGMSAVMEADKEKSLNKDNVDKEIIDKMDITMGGLTPIEKEITDSDELKSESIDNYSDDSLSEKIVDLYMQAIESFGESVTEQDVTNLTNRYIEAIRNCDEFSDDDKNLLFTTLSIGNAAFKFWSRFLGK